MESPDDGLLWFCRKCRATSNGLMPCDGCGGRAFERVKRVSENPDQFVIERLEVTK